AAEVERNDVDACGGKTPGKVVPYFALAIALMKKNHAWAGLGRREIRGLQIHAVGCLEVNDARCRYFLGVHGKCDEAAQRNKCQLAQKNAAMGHKASC